MSSSQKLTDTFTAIQTVNEGKNVNEDGWMTCVFLIRAAERPLIAGFSLWCSTNWGALLQPAPLSISLLGSILILASSTADFSLDAKAPDDAPKYKWQYAKHPDSFKDCLQQMVGDGSQAFETAQAKMEIINNLTSKDVMVQMIEEIVDLIIEGSKEDIQSLFQSKITDLKNLSQKCLDAANVTDSAFENLVGLAQEMVLACTYVHGTTEQAVQQNTIQLEVLKQQKAGQAAMVKQAQAQVAFAKKSYSKAEKGFYSAVNDVPSGWTLVGMEVVGDLVNCVSGAINAGVSYATTRSQGAQTGTNSYSTLTGQQDEANPPAPAAAPVAATTSPNGVSSQPSADSLADPGTVGVQSVLNSVNAMQSLITGNDGKPDWDKIRGTTDSKSGGLYIQASLQSQQEELDTTGPVSAKLAPYIDNALTIIAAVIKAAGSSASMNDNALDDQVGPTEQLITNLQGLLTSSNLLLQQPGSTATGPATPAPAAQAQAAMATGAAMKVTQTRATLEASRGMYEKYTDELTQQQESITTTIGKITQTKLTDVTLERTSTSVSQKPSVSELHVLDMLPVLAMAVGAFIKLRAQFSQLVQFFDHVASLLNDVMGPSLTDWIHALTSAEGEEKHVAGIKLSSFMQNLIYTGMMTPLKVSMLANKISAVYLSVGTNYILPAQRQVGLMLQFTTGPTAADQKALIAKLQEEQTALKKSTSDSNNQISALVLKDQKDFQTTITARLNNIEETLKAHIPDVAKPVPQNVQAITKAHAQDTDKTRALQAAVNPMFSLQNAF
ncbi:hypothetical protein B0H19DRAFT_1333826 [Mycena capillaripes]|nr:hypothetical protein B0H19DRAFT_1333826 [Mycena capillaripes]